MIIVHSSLLRSLPHNRCRVQLKRHMRRLTVIGLLALYSTFAISQESKSNLMLDVSYPIPIGYNYINYNEYLGFGDLGLSYSIQAFNKMQFVLGLSSSYYNLAIPDFNYSDARMTTISPKIGLNYLINLGKQTLITQGTCGYTTLIVKIPATNQDSGYNLIRHGFSYKGGMKFSFLSINKLTLYIEMLYEFTRLSKSERSDIPYNRNIQILYPGVGIMLDL
jgi:hypothetical protein